MTTPFEQQRKRSIIAAIENLMVPRKGADSSIIPIGSDMLAESMAAADPATVLLAEMAEALDETNRVLSDIGLGSTILGCVTNNCTLLERYRGGK